MRLAIIFGMAPTRWLISIAVIALAAVAGWFTAGEYKAPAQAGEERLQERVLEFYASGARFDFESMMRLYTPAQQHADSEALRKKARRWKSMFELDFDDSHRADLAATAEAYGDAEFEIRVEGDWALVAGRHDVFADSEKFRMDLDPSVWVRTGGDWWMYQLSDAELVAYGNPAGFCPQGALQAGVQGNHAGYGC